MKKLLFVLNDPNYFLSHRLSLAMFCLDHYYEVHVACPSSSSDAVKKIESYGFIHHAINLSRRGMNIVSEFNSAKEIFYIIKNVKPDIVHLLTIKPIIFGGIAARFAKAPIIVYAPTGLGYVFTDQSLKTKVLKILVTMLGKFSMRKKSSLIIFQNMDDHNAFKNENLVKGKWVLIRGSGVDTTLFNYQPEEKRDQVNVVFPARFLKDKGIVEFIEAAKIISKKKELENKIKFVLVGSIDEGNPSTITAKQLSEWQNEIGFENWGFRTDMHDVFNQADIVCLPSYREGLPKSLLEAASCAKPIITTDAPGCREVVVDGWNGYLVPVKNSQILAEKIAYLVSQPELHHLMGVNSRKMVEENFSTTIINQQTLDAYSELLKS